MYETVHSEKAQSQSQCSGEKGELQISRESSAMNVSPATLRSILDKPLNQLTEDDISQLTREDCRKYLKEKGMRRPSWNKSQAIQQVICLKALLEPCDDSGAVALRKLAVSTRVTLSPGDSAKEPSDDTQPPLSTDEAVPTRQAEPSDSFQEDSHADSEYKVTSLRSKGTINGSVGQMAIFYSGKVNVYDEIPRDKARAIMHVAAHPIHFRGDHLFGGFPLRSHSPCHLQMANEKDGPFPLKPTLHHATQSENVVECTQHQYDMGNSTPNSGVQLNRKVSLQRYREKRKDRGKVKIRKAKGLTSGFEIYLNHHERTQILSGNSSWSDTNSPHQSELPMAYVGTIENQPKFSNFSVDLNIKDVES